MTLHEIADVTFTLAMITAMGCTIVVMLSLLAFLLVGVIKELLKK